MKLSKSANKFIHKTITFLAVFGVVYKSIIVFGVLVAFIIAVKIVS